MDYTGIIITGTSGSGKSTISKLLVDKDNRFEIVKALTTREPRPDDFNYEYLSIEEFENNRKKFIIETKYRNNHYSITKNHLDDVINKNKIPILIINPESVKNSIINNEKKLNFLSFFIDTTDSILVRRLDLRDNYLEAQEEIIRRNQEDRTYKSYVDHELFSLDERDCNNILELITWLWDNKNSGGIIPYQILSLLIKCSGLIESESRSIENNISAASFDLTLGDRYFQNGQIKCLSKDNPSIIMKPGDFVIAESKEKVNLPNNIAGRFDLTVGMFCSGLILSNGPQVDPGFKGKLFCLLFNTSNKQIELWKGHHYATIEFIKLLEKSNKPYMGVYQEKDDIIEYLKITTSHSAIHQLIEEVANLKRDQWWLKYLPLIISLLSLLIAFSKIFNI